MTVGQAFGVILVLAIIIVMVIVASHVEDVDWKELERSDHEEEELP